MENKQAGYLGKLGDKGIVEKNGFVVKGRSKKEYKKLWDEFIKEEAYNYCETMGYDLDTIEKIGIEKFIDSHDWRCQNDIKKWKTDAVHIIPCSHCESEFTTFELNLGLCNKCTPLYDLEKLSNFCRDHEAASPGISYSIISQFVYNDEFREEYLK